MDFIFMLTRDDRTVRDCLALLDGLGDLRLPHLGFKDVGVDPSTLTRLHRRIKDTGATSYLEVVSTSRERALDSARMAVDLGVDWLMGGTWVHETLELLDGTGIGYLPFPGTPTGHPTRLGGTPQHVAEHCRRFEEAGCAGVDLLAYRATDVPPLDLVRAARRATSGRLVVAGSITTPEQIHDLAAAGADAFTIGSAAMIGALDLRSGTLRAQLTAILNATRTAPSVTAPSP
ncbi:hypothetical protein E1287_17330 [Actinomadura sp. KC06]|uniref:hypothetical protein n=1 Tax=Actinomadura sp. KC06 TaxID=2530369 RepID=UPI0010483874|nr:hypothetical protein [Actinomadura sp. KC06]TDD34246.1 hypothetical protein E1287_17330 [Actinomadura sp. KC06]